MLNYSYVGSELDLFALAFHWKNYYRQFVQKYVGREVLEVGAGIGATTASLCGVDCVRWLCLEPDPHLASRIAFLVESHQLPRCCEVQAGTLVDLPAYERFDTILYIDVLEHIEREQEEVSTAAKYLKRNGYLVVLSPANPALYSSFDAAIGHYRRYTKEALAAVIPGNFRCCDLFHLDSMGALASFYNRVFLKSRMPSRRQIVFWDRLLVPLSRIFDPLIHYKVGRSIFGVWQKV
jgi:2-polyprenyl-3-methyl-5-hydroxy-6-metoxy-1,4-benzoquinol methylase